jgi:hypothetical protein
VKRLFLAVLFGSVLCTPIVISQTSGFTQQGKVTHELQDEGLSLAHSSLPLNSTAKITNPSNGKSIEATVVRLIPAALGRIADVSAGVWRELELTPVTDVRISAVVPAKVPPSAPQTTVATAPKAEVTPEPQVTVVQTPVPQVTVVQTPAPQVIVTQTPASQIIVEQVPAPQGQRTVTESQDTEPWDTEQETQVADTQRPRTTAALESQDTERQAVVTQTPVPRTTVTQIAEPQTSTTPATQTVAPRTTTQQGPQVAATQGPQTTTQPAARIASTGTTQAGTGQAGTASLGDVPGGIKFENTNNFIINGNPVGGVPPVVTSETRTPTSAQPVVTYEPRPQTPQPAKPAVIRDSWPQSVQPVVTYEPPRTQTPQPVQPAKPTAITDNWPQSSQSVVTYAPPVSPQTQSTAITDNWQQSVQPVATETRPQQTTKPVNDIWAQIAMPAALIETRTHQIPVQPDKSPSVNEVLAAASRTNVFIDAPGGPKPSVTINNGTLSYMPPVPNEMRQQLVQPGGVSQVSAPANSIVRVENWPPQNAIIGEDSHAKAQRTQSTEAQSVQGALTSQTSQTSPQILSNSAATPGVVKFENWTKPGQTSQPIVNNVVTTSSGQPVINYETHTIEVPVNQAGVPMWNEIKPPSMNEIYSPVPNSRVFIDAPVDTKVPNVIINNQRAGSR